MSDEPCPPGDVAPTKAPVPPGIAPAPAKPPAPKPGEPSPEEQMERFAEELKETDWGHQPC